MTQVPIAYAGVVISYVGDSGIDVTGESFKHGNLVSKGQKEEFGLSLLTLAEYPINPYTHKVENVPTANVVLELGERKDSVASA